MNASNDDRPPPASTHLEHLEAHEDHDLWAKQHEQLARAHRAILKALATYKPEI